MNHLDATPNILCKYTAVDCVVVNF